MRIISFLIILIFSLHLSAQTLNIYNWSEYIPKSLLSKFTAETGIDVSYSTYDSNEAMYAKVKLNRSNYDIIVPSTYFVSKMQREGLLQPLDMSLIPNYKLVNPDLIAKTTLMVSKYSVPYLWGGSGIAYNTTMVRGGQVKSWLDLFRPQYVNRVQLLDDPRETIAVALSAMNLNINTRDQKDIDKAVRFLIAHKNNIRVLDSESPKDNLLMGNVAISALWNGEAYMAMRESKNIAFIYPMEGAILWVDSFAIPINSQNKDAAHKFINFMLEPENMAVVVRQFGYTPSVTSAFDILGGAYKNNAIVNIPKSVVMRSQMQKDVGDATDIYYKYWEIFKNASGK